MLLGILLWMFGTSAQAQEIWGFQDPVAEPPRIYAELENAPVRPGEASFLKVRITPAPGWYLYSVISAGEWGPLPTEVKVPTPWLEASGPLSESEPKVTFDEAYGTTLRVHDVPFVLRLPLRVLPEAPPGLQEGWGILTFQACNQKICLPASTQEFPIPLEIAP